MCSVSVSSLAGSHRASRDGSSLPRTDTVTSATNPIYTTRRDSPGIPLVMAASGGIRSMRVSRLAGVIVGVVGVALLARGVLLEILLGSDAGGLRSVVGPLEARWSLILWNPWFVVGGALLVWTAIRARARGAASPLAAIAEPAAGP